MHFRHHDFKKEQVSRNHLNNITPEVHPPQSHTWLQLRHSRSMENFPEEEPIATPGMHCPFMLKPFINKLQLCITLVCFKFSSAVQSGLSGDFYEVGNWQKPRAASLVPTARHHKGHKRQLANGRVPRAGYISQGCTGAFHASPYVHLEAL